MQTFFINLNQFAPILQTGKELTKREFLHLVKPALDDKPESTRLARFINELQFFKIIKTESGVLVS